MASYTITPELAASLQRLVNAGLLRVQNTVPPFPVRFGPAPRPSSVVLEEINEEAPPFWTQMSRGPLLLTASAGSSPVPETEAPPARESIPIELDDRSSTDETPLVVRTRKSKRAAAAKAKEALLSEDTYSSEEVPEEVVESKRSAKSAPKKRTREVSSSTATPAKKQKTPARRVTRQSARKGTEAADTELDVKDMSTRGLVKEVVVDVEYLRTHDLQEVLDLFEVQKWVDAFAATEVDEDLVREFYSTLSVEQAGNMMVGSYHRGGEVYVFTSRELAKELGVPHTGYSSYTWKYWPEGVTGETLMKEVSEDPSAGSAQVSTTKMSVGNRIIHCYVTNNIVPRQEKGSVIQIQDAVLMDKILKKEPVNLAMMIMGHMAHVRGVNGHALGFPSVVKRILTYHEVYHPQRTEVAYWSWLSETRIRQLGFEYKLGRGWVRTGAALRARKAKADVSSSKDPEEEASPDLAQMLKEGFLHMISLQTRLETDMRDLSEKVMIVLDSQNAVLVEIHKQLKDLAAARSSPPDPPASA